MNINWSLVCGHIRAQGIPMSRAAKLVGSDWRHMNRLARGEVEQPRFLTGVKILDLHHDVCGCREVLRQVTREDREQ